MFNCREDTIERPPLHFIFQENTYAFPRTTMTLFSHLHGQFGATAQHFNFQQRKKKSFILQYYWSLYFTSCYKSLNSLLAKNYFPCLNTVHATKMSILLFPPFCWHPSPVHFAHFSKIVTFPPTKAERQKTSTVGFWPAWELHVAKRQIDNREQEMNGMKRGRVSNANEQEVKKTKRKMFLAVNFYVQQRQENVCILCYTVSDDWQVISLTEFNPVAMLQSQE